MTINCVQLDKPIVITSNPFPFLTSLDVIQRLHEALQLNMGQEEYDELSPPCKSMVDKACQDRCASIGNGVEQMEDYQSRKAVDLLDGIHIFAGISSAIHQGPDSGVFELALRSQGEISPEDFSQVLCCWGDAG
jgi:hypothetical protein